MSELQTSLKKLNIEKNIDKATIVKNIQAVIEATGYEMVEVNADKPWGAYFRLNGKQADVFVNEFFPGLSPTEARLGNESAELSPKILLVSPGQRLSWQYHDRRAERWAFLTAGAYNQSMTDEPGDAINANISDVVQFAKSERHRLVGLNDSYTVVAEIWQHTDVENPSDEEDIVRLADDYSR